MPGCVSQDSPCAHVRQCANCHPIHHCCRACGGVSLPTSLSTWLPSHIPRAFPWRSATPRPVRRACGGRAEGPLDSCLSQRGHNALLYIDPISPSLSSPLPQSSSIIHPCPFISQTAFSVMSADFLQDCHYFYRTALRGLNVSTSVSPLYA